MNKLLYTLSAGTTIILLSAYSIVNFYHPKSKEVVPSWPTPTCYESNLGTYQVGVVGEFGLVLDCIKCYNSASKYVLFNDIKLHYSKVDCAYARIDR